MVVTLQFLPFLSSYKGHKNSDYKLDSSLSHDDAHVVSGSEDGRVCFWDLVEVSMGSGQYSPNSPLFL